MSVLGETQTLSARSGPGEPSADDSWDPGLLRAGRQALGLASVDQGCFLAIRQSRARVRPAAPVRSRSTRLNQDRQQGQSEPSQIQIRPLGLTLWEVSHWVTQGALPAFHENTREMTVLNSATGRRAEHPDILPFEGHDLVLVLFAHL